VKLKKLKRVAEELTALLDLKPKLKFNGDKKEFKNDILEASELLTDDDEISPLTEKLLRILRSSKKNPKAKETQGEEAGKDEEKDILSKAELVSAAKNINRELDLEPKIDINGNYTKLKEDILGASTLVKKKDQGIKLSTFRIIKNLRETYLEKGESKNMKVKDKVKDVLKKAKKGKEGENKVKSIPPHIRPTSKKHPSPGRDEFGLKIGSLPNLFVKSLIDKPKTMLEIRHEKWNTRSTTFYEAWKAIVAMGRGHRTPEGTMKILKKK